MIVKQRNKIYILLLGDLEINRDAPYFSRIKGRSFGASLLFFLNKLHKRKGDSGTTPVLTKTEESFGAPEAQICSYRRAGTRIFTSGQSIIPSKQPQCPIFPANPRTTFVRLFYLTFLKLFQIFSLQIVDFRTFWSSNFDGL